MFAIQILMVAMLMGLPLTPLLRVLNLAATTQAVPASNDGPVTTLVRDNFAELAVDFEGALFLDLYAPWCGHCRSLEPEYERLGRLFATNAHVRVAKCDATANDLSAFNVSARAFPTLKLWPASSTPKSASTLIEYRGARSAEAMRDFVLEHGGLPDAHKFASVDDGRAKTREEKEVRGEL